MYMTFARKGRKKGIISIESGILRIAVAFFSVAIAFHLLFPGVSAAGCSASLDSGCPLRINNQVVFDRCFGAPPLGPSAGKQTKVGDQICDILRDTNVIARRLVAGAKSLQQNTQKDLKAFAEVTFNEAVDRKSLEKFNDTNGMLRRIEADIEVFKNDRQCGSKAAMEALKKSFEAEVQNLRLLGEGIGKTAGAAAAMAPAALEAGNITREVVNLREPAFKHGGNAVNLFNQLNKTVQTLQNTANELGKVDVAGLNKAGGAVTTEMVPFYIDCAGCAGALALAAANIVGVATTPSVAATCLPTLGTGCVVATFGAGMGVYNTAIFLAIASPFCQSADTKADDMGVKTEITRVFFDTVTKIVDNIEKTAKNIEETRQQLDLLYREIGTQAKPSVDRISTSLNNTGKALEKGKNILREEVVPGMTRYVGNRFQIMAGQAEQLLHCYENIQGLANSVTKDVVTAAVEMGQAAGTIVDAGKVLTNIIHQGQAAAKAGGIYADQEWGACDSQEAALHKDIWGVERGKFDPGKTVGHLAYLAANPNKISSIAKRVAGLKGREATIPLRSVEEGKKAFLNLAQSKLAVGKNFDNADVLASSAAKRIAISQAKSKAKENAAKQKRSSSSTGKVTAVKPAPMPAPNVEALKPSRAGR